MATSGSITDPYSGRTQFNGYLTVSRHSVSGTSARWTWKLYARNPSGTSLTYHLNSQPWKVTVEGQSWSGNHNLDFRSGQSSMLLGQGTTGWISQGGSTRVIDMYFKHGPAGIFGTAEKSGSFTANALATVPGVPSAATFASATESSISFGISAPSSNGGSSIIDYTWQVATSSSFSSVVKSGTTTSTGTKVATGLTLETEYWVRYRARNAVGSSGWSSAARMSTLTFTGPTMSVSALPTGSGATVTVFPTGAVEPTSFEVQYEHMSPSPIPSPATKTVTSSSPVVNISGLQPAATYRWRARSLTGTHASPYSAWTTLTQPNPSTSAGDYFDGSTPANDNQTFAWTGAVNNSTSEARGESVTGWFVQPGSTGATAVLQRIRGGRFGTHAARMVIIGGANSSGVEIGPHSAAGSRADVVGGQTYFASIYVRPSRAQLLRIRLSFLNASGSGVGNFVSDPIMVQAGQWQRLVVSGRAPLDAEYAYWRAYDHMGTGWSTWKTGDYMDADGAMLTLGELLPYFDGSFATDGDFSYSWTGAANASPSLREDIVAQEADPLQDPDCPPVPSAPTPPPIDSSCIDEVGIWRRYWVTIPSTEVASWQSMIPVVELRTAGFPARQVRLRVYPNPFGYSPEELDVTDWCGEQIISYMPAATILTLDGIMQRVWAQVQEAEAVPADHLLYGTGGVPAVWPELSCGVSYVMSLDVPLDAPESNLNINLSLAARS